MSIHALNRLHRYHHIWIGLCGIFCMMTGCKTNQQPQQQSDKTAQTDTAETHESAGANDDRIAPKCQNGSREVQDKCICDDGSELLGESWFCIINGQRCFKENGCTIDGSNYAFGTDYVNGKFIQDNQDSKNEKDEAETSKYICKDNTWVKYDLSSIQYLNKRNYKDFKSDWYIPKYEANYYCGGVLVSSLGKEGEFSACEMHHPECKSNAYLCRYNHWECQDENGCKCFDGYETKSIKQYDLCENRRCIESLTENIRPNLYNSKTSWSYYSEDSDEFEHGEVPGLCLEGNCPCGDGYCMKFGTCTEGVCSCHQIKTNLHGEFYCNHYGILYDYCNNDCGEEEGGILSCVKDGGCHTSDGRHYPKGSNVGFNGLSPIRTGHPESSYSKEDRQKYWRDLAYRDNLMFHIDAGFDTTVESISPLGECVLDRNDSITRWTNIKDKQPAVSEYICDKSECTCGNKKCGIGEICRSGECIDDTCKANDKTMTVCDVDLIDGQQYFQHPGKPDVCINPSVLNYEDEIDDFYDEISKAIGKKVSFDDLYFGSYLPMYKAYLESHKSDARKDDIHDSPLIKASGKLFYDVIECKGGHRYCHGKNNDPIRISDKPDGWKCMDVNSLPGVETNKDLKAWVCDNESGCMCGDTSCEYAQSCIDDQCVDVSLPYDECRGKDDAMKISKSPDGWKCMDVTILPEGENSKTKVWVCDHLDGCMCNVEPCKYAQGCVDGKCTEVALNQACDGKTVEKDYKCVTAQNGITYTTRQIGMICTQSECICGNSHCPKNALCRNGRCLNREREPFVIPTNYKDFALLDEDYNEPYAYADYEDDNRYPSQYYKKYTYNFSMLKCDKSSGCQCNGKLLNKGETCSMPCYGDGRLDENGCWCGDVKLNDVENETCLNLNEKYYVLCNDPEGCVCGETKCPMSSYCLENQCMDPITGQPLPKSSQKLALMPICTDESCPCGNMTCKKGEFCNGVTCNDKVYANILHGKRYFYDERIIKVTDSRYQPGDEKIDWNLIQSYDMSEFNPDNLPLDEYAFMPYYDTFETHDCEEEEMVFVKENLSCMLSSGCQCGEHLCPWGAGCIKGECVYSDAYKYHFCGVGKYELQHNNKISISGKGATISCNGTTIIPSEPQIDQQISKSDEWIYYDFKPEYECTEDGWKCSRKSGCQCGDQRCAWGAYCIRPGLCTQYDSDAKTTVSSDGKVSESENSKP